MRALVGAIALGSSAGLVVGGAYLAGSSVETRPVRPVPAVAGSLQAARAPAPHTANVAPSPMVLASGASRSATPRQLPLRDRFRVAAEAIGAAARPFHFQTVADAPSDLHCLTEAVYFEARGEAPAGQQAVAQVVLNRVRHPAFPKTICAVVHQHTGSGCQFSFACGSQQAALNSVAWRRAQTIASSEMHGAVMTAVGDATHFQAARASPFAGLLKVAQVGAHIFYRFGGHAGTPAMFHQAPTVSPAPAKVELARLDPVAAPGPLSAVSPEGRVRVTLYPGPVSPAPVVTRSEVVGVKLVSTTSADVKPEPMPVAHTVPVLPTAAPAKTPDAPTAKPAVVPMALAQS